MAVAFVAAANAGTTVAATSVVCSVPTGTSNQNVMLAIATTAQGVTVTQASWTALGSSVNGSTGVTAYLFYRIASSEPANYTFTLGSSTTGAVSILTFSGTPATFPIRSYASNSFSQTTSSVAPSLVGVTPGTFTGTDMVVVLAGGRPESSGTPTIDTTSTGGWAEPSGAKATATDGNFAARNACSYQTAVDSSTVSMSGSAALGGVMFAVSLVANTGTHLPANQFTDNFDNNLIDGRLWNNWGGAQVVESGAKQTITSTLAAAYFGNESYTWYDLTGCSVSAQFTAAGNTALASWEVYPVYINCNSRASGDALFWYLTGTTIQAMSKASGTNTSRYSATYSSSTHAWLRIRESGGTTFFDSSTDGKSWTNRGSLTNLAAGIAQVSPGWQCGTWQTEASTTSASIDNFSVCLVDPPTGGFRQVINRASRW